MENNDESFSPELVEEQIERFRDLLPSEDALLIHRLQQAYQHESEINARSLNSVWERIQHQHFASPSQEAYLPSDEQDMHIQMQIQLQRNSNNDKRNSNMGKISARGGHISRLFGMIAAAIFVVLLVGSFALVFREAAQRGMGATAGHRPTAIPVVPTPTPAPASGIYISSMESDNSYQIYRLDKNSHNVIWSQSVGELSAFNVVGNIIYVSAASKTDLNINYVFALDAYTGHIKWRSELVSQYTSSDLSYPGLLTMPAASSNAVYTIARDGTVYALNAVNGHQLWSYMTGSVALVDGTVYDPGDVSVSNGTVYATIANHLFAINAKSGKKVWSAQIDATQIFNSPQVVNNAVFLSSYEISHHYDGQSQTGAIYSYDAESGKRNWLHSVDNWVLSSPTVVDNMVFFGSYDTNIYALHANDGSEIWQYHTGGQIFSSPLVSHGVIYAQGNRNASEGLIAPVTVKPELFAIDEFKGTKLWSVQMNALPQVVQDGVLYAGVFPRIVYALNVSNGSVIWNRQYSSYTTDKDKYPGGTGITPQIFLVP